MSEGARFGYKTAWLAIRSSETDQVVKALGLLDARPAAPGAGIDAALEMESEVFVTAPIRGWTLCVGGGVVNYAGAPSPRELAELVTRLSAELGCEVQLFATHRVVEAHAWARAVGGELRRAYSWLGESGETLLDEGEPTPEERALGFFEPPFPRDPHAAPDDAWVAGEAEVMQLAGRWSLDPTELDIAEHGILGTLPGPRPDVSAPAAPPGARPWWKLW